MSLASLFLILWPIILLCCASARPVASPIRSLARTRSGNAEQVLVNHARLTSRKNDNVTDIRSRDLHLDKRFDSARYSWYNVGLGACGGTNSNNQFVVALNGAQYSRENCYKMITISYGGKSTTAQIVDECPDCPYGGLDLSPGLFSFLAPISKGIIYGAWNFNGGGGGSPPPKPQPPAQAPSSSPHPKYVPSPTTTLPVVKASSPPTPRPNPNTSPVHPNPSPSPSPSPSSKASSQPESSSPPSGPPRALATISTDSPTSLEPSATSALAYTKSSRVCRAPQTQTPSSNLAHEPL